LTRESGSFRRIKKQHVRQATVLILCEDSKSSLIYLKEASQFYRVNAKVLISHPGSTDPGSIVNTAKLKAKDFDKVYCVFDRDEHANFDDALSKALSSSPKITPIVSYPCFEYWLLLHFERSRKPFNRKGGKSPCDCVANELATHTELADYHKGKCAGLFKKLLHKLPTARENANWAMNDASTTKAINPSTQFHILLQDFEELGSE
jgi:hypothetical protein